jgi:hypothetical protein
MGHNFRGDMDILNSEFIYRIRSMINPNYRSKDFSFYINRLKKIAPISTEVLGDKFFLEKFPAYFQELQINEENLTENLFYLPIFLKKYQAKFSTEAYAIELIDYEFSCYQIMADPMPVKSSIYNDLTTEIYLNPMAQALRLENEIHEYAQAFVIGKLNKSHTPAKNRNLLFISKNSETQQLSFLRGNTHHAAIVDELTDGRMIKKGLIQNLQAKYPEIAQREWIIALKDLKSHFVIIEN